MTALFAAAVGGLSPLELFELFAAGCFASAVAAGAATAWWMQRRWEAEVAAEWADGMADEQQFVHTPCGTPLAVLDDGSEWCPVCDVEITHEAAPLATGGVVVQDRLYIVGEDGPVDITPFAHHRRRNG